MKKDDHTLSLVIRQRAQAEVFAIARRALCDLATTDLEQRVTEAFIRRLRALDDQAKAGFAKALKTASEPALVRSAFDLPAEQRTAIQHALRFINVAVTSCFFWVQRGRLTRRGRRTRADNRRAGIRNYRRAGSHALD